MSPKVRSEHLARPAIIYIRQSTLAQVIEHRQSTERQYNLAELAKRLGWEPGLVQVIDEDLGHSGESVANRSGFQRLAAEVSLGRVGAILSLEVSRLARSSADWHRLLDLCALSNSLIIDDDGVYDPNDFNDRLVLGMKGTMSDAERHLMRLRLQGGKLHKARKGELVSLVPTGYAPSDDRGTLVLDPDEHVQKAVRLLFARFPIDGTAYGVVRYFSQHKLQFPLRRVHKGTPAEIEWKRLTSSRALAVLKNPTYAGAYVYGRTQQRRVIVNGTIRRRETNVSREEWYALMQNAHPGYITWETHMANIKQLEENARRVPGLDRRGGPRKGEALLQGLVLCGRCGRRMSTAYSAKERPRYLCRHAETEPRMCWSVSASAIDARIAEVFLEAFAPSEIDLSLAVLKEVEHQAGDVDRQWKLRLERARYDAERAQRQYNAVEPENRIVARTLETQWNEKLQELEQVERDYEATRRSKKLTLSATDKKAILALARDLPRVWHAKTTMPADRKKILRLLIQDVAMTPIDLPERATKIRILWKTGAVSEVFATCEKPPSRKTSEAVLAAVRKLAKQGLADVQIADELNRLAIKSGRGRSFTRQAVTMLRRRHEIASARAPGGHLPAPDQDSDGRYSIRGLASRYGVTDHIVRYWIKLGVVPVEPEHLHGSIRIALSPKIDAAIRQVQDNSYGPRSAVGRRRVATTKGRNRVYNSHARSNKER